MSPLVVASSRLIEHFKDLEDPRIDYLLEHQLDFGHFADLLNETSRATASLMQD
jgi:hypothetical protein